MTRRFNDTSLVIATHNAGKMQEIADLLSDYDVVISSAADHDLGEPEETEATFVGNARIKAHAASKMTGLPALADDSGIEVEALGDAPGVFTADWSEGPHGRDFVKAMTRTWNALEDVNAAEPRKARFCATLVLAWPDGHDEVFEGRMTGRIDWPMRGDQGHGYDPIFQPDGYDITFGEMDRWEKNRISHRADAFRKLVAGCFA